MDTDLVVGGARGMASEIEKPSSLNEMSRNEASLTEVAEIGSDAWRLNPGRLATSTALP